MPPLRGGVSNQRIVCLVACQYDRIYSVIKPIGQIIIPAGVEPESQEIKAANVFAGLGETVCFVKPENRNRVKSADVKLYGKIWEIKSPISDKMVAVERNLKKATKQSSRIIFDCRRMKKIPSFKIRREVERQLKRSKAIDEIIFIDKHGKTIDFKK